MSEPTTFADRIEMPLPGLLHWTLQDDRINFRSDAYGLVTPDGVVLIDPLPLSESALSESLDAVAAICLTEGQHQRSAWTYRKRFGAPVHAPEGAHGLDESPDHWYADGDLVPGGLAAISTPGFGTVHCALLAESGPGGRVLFSGDLVVRTDDGVFDLIPDKYVDAPPGIRDSVARLVDLAPDVLCPAHGSPALTEARVALEEALNRRH